MARSNTTAQIIGAAIKVHRRLGPGLLESAYEACLVYELEQLGLHVQRQKAVPLIYKSVKLECGFRADLDRQLRGRGRGQMQGSHSSGRPGTTPLVSTPARLAGRTPY